MKNTRYMFARFVADSLLTPPTASSNGICQHNKMFVMKKIFISIFAVAAMLNLCSCSNEIIDKPCREKAIVFNNIQTRDIVNSANDILSMGVFAQMNLGDEDKQEPGSNDFIMLLENEHVSRVDADPSTLWTYENTCYWVADRIFHFFAVWPYSGENSSVTNVKSIAPATGEGAYGYSLTFDTPEAADQDLLTAQATVKAETNDISDPVGLNFQHELTNVNLKVWSNGAPENVNDKIRVKEVTLSNVTKKGTLNTTVSGSSWSYSSEKIAFKKTFDGDGISVSPAQINDGKFESQGNSPGVPFGEEGLLLIPHTITNSNPVVVTVIYDLKRPIDAEEDPWEEKKLMAVLPEGTWPAGKKLTYNLVISGDRTITEFQINTVVEDWKTQTEEIDFTQEVVVDEDEKMKWVEGTYESINKAKGEVVLFTDIDKVAVCEFNISTPVGATWTASLIPLTASAMDAFSIVEDSKYGEVGTDRTQSVKIKINNPDPISARNACKLRITVQTPDGRTIVVNNLMPDGTDDDVTEYTIIQNLING